MTLCNRADGSGRDAAHACFTQWLDGYLTRPVAHSAPRTLSRNHGARSGDIDKTVKAVGLVKKAKIDIINVLWLS